MRRRWPALAATIPMVLGWAVAAAYPASASAPARPGAVQPGGPVSSLSTPGMPSGTVTPQITGQQPQAVPGGGLGGGGQSGGGQGSGAQNSVVTSSNWAGYVATGRNGTFTSTSANWTEPVGPLQRRGRQVRRVLGRARRLHQPHGRADRHRGRLLRVLPPVLRLVRDLPGRGGELPQPGQPRRPVHRQGHLHRAQHVQPGPQGQHQGLDAGGERHPGRRGAVLGRGHRRGALLHRRAAASCR